MLKNDAFIKIILARYPNVTNLVPTFVYIFLCNFWVFFTIWVFEIPENDSAPAFSRKPTKKDIQYIA